MGFDWKANDVDTGFTTLTSMPMDLSAMYEPKLRYSVWYVALSFNGPEPVPTDGDELVVQASSDDGVTWTEIDRVEGDPRAWERREAPFANVDTGAPVRVRFVATDQGSEQNLVEVGIDDVQIVSLSKDCEGGGGGCGCKVGGRGTGGTAAFVLFALGLIAVRSRSRSRSRS
jgi:MYXO-CTERM domain-containing protein